MKAVLCAAGLGNRMLPYTAETPKPLLPVGDKTIIEYLIDSLSASGVREAVVVVGYKREMIEEKLGRQAGDCHIDYVYNEDFAKTNNIYSLWLARDLISDGMIFFNCDIVFSDCILRSAIDSVQEDCLVVDQKAKHVDDTMGVWFEDGHLADIGKKISRANGWAMGIYKLSARASQEYFKICEDLFLEDEINKNISFVVPLRILATGMKIGMVPVINGSWAEVDVPADYEEAINKIEMIRRS